MALKWYREQAGAGNVFARRGLALSYEVGYRVEPNEGAAVAIEKELLRDAVSGDYDLLFEWIPKQAPYRPQQFNNFLAAAP